MGVETELLQEVGNGDVQRKLGKVVWGGGGGARENERRSVKKSTMDIVYITT